MTILTYKRNTSQKAKVESITEENIFFKDEYKRVLTIIADILDPNAKSTDNDQVRENNRILVTGQRGSGKSSVLLSVKKHLEEEGLDIDLARNGEIKGGNTKFHSLPMVDPSYFDGKNNILTTVLSKILSQAKERMEKNDGKSDRSKYEVLLRNLNKVYKALGQIETVDSKSSYTLENLNEKSSASDMHSLMSEMLESYISFMKGKGNENMNLKILLVIDDLDMNVDYAAVMMEQLRKFLSLKNLVILMSANLAQLHNEMRENYSKAFRNTLNDKNQALSIAVDNLASKYLLKLFPTTRRVNVERPIEQLLEAKVLLEGNDNPEDLQHAILSLIWSKTRLLFIPRENEWHPIIPTNLRELMQFVDLLYDMMDVKYEKDGRSKMFAEKDDYDHCKENVQKFKTYFLNTWIPSNLPVEQELLFNRIPTKIDEINKHLINSINAVGTDNKKRLMSREVDLDIIEKNAEGVSIDRDIYTMVSPNDPRFVKANKISDIFNQPSNYSYGDLLLMIDKYETYFEAENDRKFSDAIKIYYSILLFETMFFRGSDDMYDNPNEKSKCLDNPIPIQKLIGGTVYYPNYFEIISSKYFKQRGPSYDAKRAFYHKFEVNEGSDVPLFSVLYYGDVRPDRYDLRHVYDTTYKRDRVVDGKEYMTFDILSIFNNMLNPWHTVARSNHNLDSWEERINQWKQKCSIDSHMYSDAILPFYSVDLMLEFIRQSYNVQDVCSPIVEDSYVDVEKSANWLGLMNSGGLQNKDDWKKCGELCNTIRGIFADSVYKEKAKEVFGEITTDACPVSCEKANDLLKNNIKILLDLHECFNNLTAGCPKQSQSNCVENPVERFRDHAISKIMSLYNGSRKDQDTIVKNLHKYDTVTEIYRYLVDILWKDAIMEQCVRIKIQAKIRTKQSVEEYFNKLKNKTEQAFRRLFVLEQGKEIQTDSRVAIYQTRYTDGVTIFIKEEELEDEAS